MVAPDTLNIPEEFLQNLAELGAVAQHTVSDRLDTDITANDPNALHAGFIGDLASQLTHLGADGRALILLYEAWRNHGLTDDRKYLLEYIVQVAASLPSDSPTLKKLTDEFIKLLWDNLNHPPLTYLGDEWRFRCADGSNNNRMYPELGKSGSPYARTVPPKIELPPTLPDAGLLFDELMARGPEAREHPNQISSMLFYMATIIIHDIFRTNDRDWNKVDNSSYLDLAPLYGHNEEQLAKVRSFKDGKLKPDTFSEVRILGFPPGVAALLCSFNRFHNWIAEQLAEIDKGGRFTLKKPTGWAEEEMEKHNAAAHAKRDHDLFQTARLITCGLYINIILIDYVRTILNLNQCASEWSLDPRVNADKIYGPSKVPEGIGNSVSVEFNLVYRWHSAISKRDEKWSIEAYEKAFGKNVDVNKLTTEELRAGFMRLLGPEMKKDPGERVFGGLTRQANGSFKDADLVELISAGTEDPACAFGPRNVPVVMRAIEVLGIEQARKWNVATLNEFRMFFGLTPHKKFSDISRDPDVSRSLETLYGHPDYVELYPGLVVEDAKEPKFPGSGLCPGFTISKAILSDAVALVRGDRFYTLDYNATCLTNWGFNEQASDPTLAGGAVIYKLLYRAFPNFYPASSAYAYYPFTVPAKTKEILQSLGTDKDYDFSRPTFVPDFTEITTYEATVKILEDQKNFPVPWGPHTYDLTGHDFMLSGDSPQEQEQKQFVDHALYCPQHAEREIQQLYEAITTAQLAEKSRKLRSAWQVDAVADVGNLSHAIAVAKIFHVPLKLPGEPVSAFTAQEFYTIMSLLFAYVFLDVDNCQSMKLRSGAKQSGEVLGKVMGVVVGLVQAERWADLGHLVGAGMRHDKLAQSYGAQLIKRWLAGGKSVEEVTWAMIPTIAGAVGTQAQGVSHPCLTVSKLTMHSLLRFSTSCSPTNTNTISMTSAA